ncbi:16657_t:CDS:1, partial [Gigaspora rosea]
WNQDPLAFSNSLLITRNQVLVTDENTILLSLQLPTEDPDFSQNDFLNDYTEPITELPNEELTLLPEVNEPDNIKEHKPNLVPVSGLTRIKEDLMSTETVSV